MGNDNNGTTYTLCCIDYNGLRNLVRLRIQNDGILQMYIEYNDTVYIYCIEKRNWLHSTYTSVG